MPGKERDNSKENSNVDRYVVDCGADSSLTSLFFCICWKNMAAFKAKLLLCSYQSLNHQCKFRERRLCGAAFYVFGLFSKPCKIYVN